MRKNEAADILKSSGTVSENKKIPGWLILIIIAACLLTFGCLQFFDAFFREKDLTGHDPAADSIVNVFSVDQEFYYIRENGQFLKRSDNEDVLVRTLPTYIAHWSSIRDSVLFYEDGSVCFYDPVEDSVTHTIKAETGAGKKDPCYVILATEQFVYLQQGLNTYKVSISNGEAEPVSDSVKNQLYCDDRYSVFQASDYNQLFVMELSTDNIQELTLTPDSHPIISACIADETLYFVRSDGIIQGARICGGMIDDPITLNSPENVLAIAPFEDKLVCAVGKSEGDMIHPSVVLYDNGTIIELSDFEKPNYTVPGSCMIAVSGSRYCLAVTTDTVLCLGNIADKLE